MKIWKIGRQIKGRNTCVTGEPKVSSTKIWDLRKYKSAQKCFLLKFPLKLVFLIIKLNVD